MGVKIDDQEEELLTALFCPYCGACLDPHLLASHVSVCHYSSNACMQKLVELALLPREIAVINRGELLRQVVNRSCPVPQLALYCDSSLPVLLLLLCLHRMVVRRMGRTYPGSGLNNLVTCALTLNRLVSITLSIIHRINACATTNFISNIITPVLILTITSSYRMWKDAPSVAVHLPGDA